MKKQNKQKVIPISTTHLQTNLKETKLVLIIEEINHKETFSFTKITNLSNKSTIHTTNTECSTILEGIDNSKFLNKKRKSNIPNVKREIIKENKKKDVELKSDKVKKDKKSDHFQFKLGMRIKNYKVTKLLGNGTFGRVLEVIDNDEIPKALKVIRPVPKYMKYAQEEADMLTNIYKQYKMNSNKDSIVKIYDTINFSSNKTKYFGILFEKLGKSLFQVIEENSFIGKDNYNNIFRITN